jgi:hypothetical protein
MTAVPFFAVIGLRSANQLFAGKHASCHASVVFALSIINKDSMIDDVR